MDRFDWNHVTAIGSRVLGKLDDVWEEMGMLEQEKSKQLEFLQKSIEEVFSTKLKDELLMMEEYKTLSQTLLQNINHLTFDVLILSDSTEKNVEVPIDCRNNLMRKLHWLRNEHERLEKLREERMNRLGPLRDSIERLGALLGETTSVEFLEIGTALTESKIKTFEQKDLELKKLQLRREEEIVSLCKDVAFLIEELEFFDITELDTMALKKCNMENESKSSSDDVSMPLTTGIIDSLSERASFFTAEKKKRTDQLRKLGAQIEPLWDLLEVSDEKRQKFFAENTGLGIKIVERCEQELNMLLTKKKEKIKDLIQSTRRKIEDLWWKLAYSAEQRAEKEVMMLSGDFTEELYEKHSEYLEIVSAHYATLAPLLERFEKYKELCAERDAYEALIKDSSRLLDRRRGISQLKEEELQRKRVTKTLPSLIDKLSAEVSQYESKHGPLTIDGKPMLKLIRDKEMQHDRRKELEKMKKKEERASSAASGMSTPKSIATKSQPTSKTKMSVLKQGMALERQRRNDENSKLAGNLNFA